MLATVLFSDIVGSTQAASRLGDRRWRALLDAHYAVVRAELDRFGGREIDTAGDGLFAAFAGPARAISCACAMRDAVRTLGLESGSACTPARSKPPVSTWQASPSISVPGWRPRHSPARYSSPAPSPTW
jgi:class 3 adenylate cyclase